MGKNVTHLIVGLGKGGAETMLYQVLKYQTNPSINYKVISLGASHYYEQPIRDLGIPVVEIPIRKKPVSTWLRIRRELKDTNTLCCWMDHANFVGALVGKGVGVKKIVWNVRHSNLDPRYDNRLSLFINSMCAKISKRIDVIAYNGIKARKVHEECGFCKAKGLVLDNGVDTSEFYPEDKASENIRKELHIPEKKRIILSVARNNPIKDLPNFIEAFTKVHREHSDTVAIMCGSGITADDRQVSSLCQKNHLTMDEDIYLLGMRNDIPEMMAGCDLYVLHSAGEAFPNTLLQAMSCGCICVTTDVGDAGVILGDDRWVVPAKDSEKLCSAMVRSLGLSGEERQEVSFRNRNRVLQNYSINRAVKKYEELY